MHIMGIDIGTTTISIVIMDTDSGELTARRTIEHRSFLPGELPESRVQDPERIWMLLEEAVQELSAEYGMLCGIGLTGQMHGMLYVDAQGNAVSPLYTWQDGCGGLELEAGRSSAQILTEQVGSVSSGYGLATHFFLQKTGRIPEGAVKMTTISDYAAMKLTGRTEPVIASDMAASWGCFDAEHPAFYLEKLEAAGVDTSFLPHVMSRHDVVGRTPEGIPVVCSLGDNQASVIGTVQDLQDTVLINVGTGSQVSAGTSQYFKCSGSIELRPCSPAGYILVGSSLCGGRAYAMLEQFYRDASGYSDGTLYDRMYQQAEEFLEKYGKEQAWNVSTTFSGTRSNPSECGKIGGIRTENFTPAAMTVGVIQGILEELYGYYEKMCELTGHRAVQMVGSGNGLRKNALMRRLAEERFGLKMKIPAYQEEAACGAALLAMAVTGVTGSLEEAQKKIVYIE